MKNQECEPCYKWNRKFNMHVNTHTHTIILRHSCYYYSSFYIHSHHTHIKPFLKSSSLSLPIQTLSFLVHSLLPYIRSTPPTFKMPLTNPSTNLSLSLHIAFQTLPSLCPRWCKRTRTLNLRSFFLINIKGNHYHHTPRQETMPQCYHQSLA